MNNLSKFLFGDLVVYKDIYMGVVVKTWYNPNKGYTYDVYVRSYNRILEIPEAELERYRVRHKELNKTEVKYQKGTM